jgi:hypothetical protein
MLQITPKKTYHKVVVFSTCVYLMHHGGDMEKSLWWNFAINDGLYLNLSLWCEIGPHYEQYNYQLKYIFNLQQCWHNIVFVKQTKNY